MRTNRWLPAFLGLCGLVVLGGAGASVASAQARELGNPYGPSVGATASVDEPTSAIVPVAPPAYSDVSVPSPPGVSGGVYAAPRGSVLADSPDVHIATTIALRLRAVDADLQILAARGGGSFLDGVLMIVSGGATALWGVVMDTSGPTPGHPSPAEIYLYTYAATSITRGILSFALMTNPSGPAIRYSHMPMANMHDVRERLRYGELQLDSLADQARIARILDGSLNLAVGLAVLPVYFGQTNFAAPNGGEWFVVVLAGLSTVMGVITLVSTSEPERRQAAYHELRDRVLSTPEGMSEEDALEAAASEPAESTLSVTPILSMSPTGGFAGATVTF